MGIVILLLISPFFNPLLFATAPPKYEYFLRIISWLFIFLTFCHFLGNLFMSYVYCSFQTVRHT